MSKKIVSLTYLFSLGLLLPSPSYAFKHKTASLGFGYYSQNVLNKTAAKDDGSTGLLGEPSYPLNLKFDYSLTSDLFLAPVLSYTVMPRATPGDSAKVTIAHLVFQFGKNFGGGGSSTFDWYVGPGLISYEIKGAGGTTVLSNGTTTATFAVPGKNISVRKVTANFGGSINFNQSRIGLDLIVENIMSSKKRTQSMMLSYAYQFGGGLF